MGWRACLGLLFALLLGACSQQLYGGLGEHDANQIVGALRLEGMSATKRLEGEKGWRVEIASADFARAVVLLRNQNLPPQNFDGLGTVFRKDSLVSTEVEERARFTHALAQELQRTISQMDGVLLARVHPVVASNDPFSGRAKVASASVFVKHRAGLDLTPRVQQIRELVANGIEGLAPERVSVALLSADAKATPLPPAQGLDRDSLVIGAAAAVAVVLAGVLLMAALIRLRVGSLRGAAARAWTDTTQFGVDAPPKD